MSPEHVESYKGWDIYYSRREGYYLIGEADDDELMNRPFASIKTARRFIDAVPVPDAEESLTFNQRFVRNFVSRKLWLNFIWLLFCFAAIMGSITQDNQGMSKAKSLMTTLFGLALNAAIIAAVWAAVVHFRRAPTAPQPEPVAKRPRRRRDDEDDMDFDVEEPDQPPPAPQPRRMPLGPP